MESMDRSDDRGGCGRDGPMDSIHRSDSGGNRTTEREDRSEKKMKNMDRSNSGGCGGDGPMDSTDRIESGGSHATEREDRSDGGGCGGNLVMESVDGRDSRNMLTLCYC